MIKKGRLQHFAHRTNVSFKTYLAYKSITLTRKLNTITKKKKKEEAFYKPSFVTQIIKSQKRKKKPEALILLECKTYS